MIEFFSAMSLFNKILFGSLGVIFLIGVPIVIIWAVRTQQDRGFMKDENGANLRWPSTPVFWYYPEDIDTPTLAALRATVREINAQCGTLYDLGTPTERAVWSKYLEMWDKGLQFSGALLIDVVDTAPEHGGSTELRWNEKGRIVGGRIRLGKYHSFNPKVVKHEFGHGVGLAHDDKSTSIMHEQINKRPQELTDADAKRLRKVYKWTAM